MNVQIRKVVDFGTHESERIILDVKEDCDIGDFLVLDTTYTDDNKVSNKVRHPFWFPDQKVAKGDVVVLYTKTGTNSIKNETDHTTYFYYWNLKSSVWNDLGDCAILMHLDQWSHKKANV